MAKLPFSFFLALRYLKPKRTFVSVITVMSVVGVALGVMVLIVVIAVMAGFQRRLTETLIAVEPHLTMVDDRGPQADEGGFPVENDWREVAELVAGVPGVEAVSPVVEGFIGMVVNDEPLYLPIRAIDPERDAFLGQGGGFGMMDGEFDLTGDGVVMSFVMARRLGVGVGDTLTLFSDKSLRELVKLAEAASDGGEDGDGEGEGKSLGERMRESVLPVDVTVVGLLDTTRETASSYLVLPLSAGQDLYELGEMVPQLAIRVGDPYSVEGMLRKIEAALGDRAWSGWTWTRKHRDALQAVQMERIMMYFVLFVIVLVAAFSVMNTMITVTVQKRQEIGMTGALGAKVSQIVWVFLAQGMVVGGFGVIAGTALGALLLRFREQFRWVVYKLTGFEIFDVATYGTFEIPARVVPGDVAVICSGAFLLCTLAALAPAYFAARIDPARALRNL